MSSSLHMHRKIRVEEHHYIIELAEDTYSYLRNLAIYTELRVCIYFCVERGRICKSSNLNM